MQASCAAALAAALTLIFVPAGDAHLVAKPKTSSLEHRLAAQDANLSHARYVALHGRGAVREWHRRAEAWLSRELAETRRALQPAIPHRALWLCIHSREGAWDDGGWPYWGGLQAGGWWLSTYLPAYASPRGSVGPGGWLNAPSAEVQMAAAERGYRSSRYSRAWLFGQWPNTAPPCAHLA